MSLVLLGASAAGAFYLVGDYVDENNRRMAEIQKSQEPPKTVVQRELYTGRYGDWADIAEAAFDETMIQSIQVDRDLSGVPCRWVHMQNGGVYKTYDMNFPQKK